MSSNVIALPLAPILARPKLRRLLVLTAFLSFSASAFVIAFLLRFDFRVPLEDWTTVAMTLPLVVALRWLSYLIFSVDTRPLRSASPADFLPVLKAVTCSSVVFALVVKVVTPDLYFPRSVLLIEWLLSAITVGGIYAVCLAWRENLAPARTANRRVLVLGGGPSLTAVLKDMQASGRWNPVGVLIDDNERRGEKLLGVTIEGPFHELVHAARHARADVVCFVNPGISLDRLPSLIADCRRNDLEFIFLQTRSSQAVTAPDPAGSPIELLLQRDEVSIDMRAVKRMVTGRNVLVTGAGGSIGSELSRQVAALEPKSLYLLERSENNLFFINRELQLRYPKLNLHPLLVDITDHRVLSAEFNSARPDIVFHAAAHKHVGMMETRPQEAIRNNVLGTYNVAMAAARAGAERFINISTDKAVRPKSFMGLSKRLAETVIHEMNERFDTQFATVRFGNVAGSNGSVIPLFRQQIAQGGPVTVTDPRARRFFMSIPEAVRLVLQAAVFSQRGGILVLDMGKPLEIYELAKMMISLSGYLPHVDIPIEFTRLGSAEKMTEELQDEGEDLQPTDHSRVLSISPRKIEPLASMLQRIPRWQRLVDRGLVSELMDEVFEVWPGLGKDAIKTIMPPMARGAGNSTALRVN